MWYLIISIIAMFIAHVLLYANHKTNRRGSYSEHMGPGVVVCPFILGFAWPLSLVWFVSYIVFKKYLTSYYDKLITWLSKHLFTDL